jgi:hypothetical protein
MPSLDELIADPDTTDAGLAPERSIARDHRPPARRARVLRLQRDVADAAYAPDLARVAQALLARVRVVRSAP